MLPCHVTPNTATNITWLQIPRKPSRQPLYNIYANGRILQENVRHRFSINNASVGDYSLKISHIQESDAGQYQCFDQQQLLQKYVIYVSG